METIIQELKQLIIDSLELEDMTVDDIAADEPLFDEGLGLDSIDALELGVALKNKYGISVKDEDEELIKKYFSSVRSLAELVSSHKE